MDRIIDTPVPVITHRVEKIQPAGHPVPVSTFHGQQTDAKRQQNRAEKNFRKRLLAHIEQLNPVVAERGWQFRLSGSRNGIAAELMVECLDTEQQIVLLMTFDECLALTPDTILNGGFFVNQQC